VLWCWQGLAQVKGLRIGRTVSGFGALQGGVDGELVVHCLPGSEIWTCYV
jgi:hypothetical protein